MQRTVVLASAVLAAISLAAAADTSKEDEAAIKAASAGWISAYNAGDANAIMAVYTDDAVVMAPGAPVAKGASAIKQLIEKQVASTRASGITLVLGGTHDVAVSGELGWDSGNYTVRDKAGTTVDSGSYLAAWKKTGGKWKIVRDMWNSDRPPADAAPAKPKGK
jgi:uncharacterized protein (TIGR02246 family)